MWWRHLGLAQSDMYFKDSAPDELIQAIRQSLLNIKYLSPKFPERLGNSLAELIVTETQDPFDTLTEREREVFQMASEGKTASEIAGLLSISPRTVEIHRRNLLSKLGIRNQADLIQFAIKRGILPMDN